MKLKLFALMLIAFASMLTGCGDSKKMVGPSGTNNQNSEVARYRASLTGASEVPPTGSNATGTAEFSVMQDGSIRWSLHTTGLANVVASHIHSGPVGQNAPVAFGLFSGGPTGDLALSGVITDTNTVHQLIDLFDIHSAYVNVHTTGFQAGEIRGQILQATGAAPSPWSRVTDVPQSDIYSLFVDGPTIIAGADEAAYVSTDAGGTFTRSATIKAGVPLRSVKMRNGRIYAGTGNRGGVFVSDDLGRTWLDFNQGLVGIANSQLEIVDLLIHGVNVYAATDGFGVWIRNLASGTWTHFGDAFGPARWLDVKTIDAGGSRLLVSAGFNGQVFFRDPGQPDWTESLLENDRMVLGLAPLRAIWTGAGWVEGTSRGVYVSALGQSPWRFVDVGIGSVDAVSFALRGNDLFGCFVNEGSTIETSHDNGATWQVFESQPGVLTETIAVSGSVLYAGRADGLWRRSIATTSDVP